MTPPEFTGGRKASYSANGNNCVEVAAAPGVVGVRDPKLGEDSPIVAISRAEGAPS
jgi:hypothetical protein